MTSVTHEDDLPWKVQQLREQVTELREFAARQEQTIAELRELVGETVMEAVDVALRYGMVDGAHHKQWVIDQMLRRLLGNEYPLYVGSVRSVSGDWRDWDEGMAP